MDPTNQAIEGQHEEIASVAEALTDDQTAAERDQFFSDSDQTGSDSDQTAALGSGSPPCEIRVGFAELASEDSAAELIRRADAQLPDSLRS